VTEDLVVGTGATAVNGDTVSVFYTGSFLSGQVFDTNVGGNALVFRLGARAVIAGFEQGIVGMKVGGKRRLTIPPSLAYGSQGQGPIPPNTTLRFDVDLASIAASDLPSAPGRRPSPPPHFPPRRGARLGPTTPRATRPRWTARRCET
jgi:hypothetical protein